MDAKGAFQLSMSLIVIVVFAVILLGLSIGWLQDIFKQINPIIHDVTKDTIQRVREQINSGDEKIGIAAPAIAEWKRGESGSYAILIENEDDLEKKRFYINIYLDNANKIGVNAADVEKWLDYLTEIIVDPSEIESTNLIIKPASDAKKEEYMFVVVVCTKQPCTTIAGTPEENFYGFDTFALEII